MATATEKAAKNEAAPSTTQKTGEDAGKATDATAQGGDTSAAPKTERRKARTVAERIAELEALDAARKEKAKGRNQKKLADVEERIGKLNTQLEELRSERQTIRAELGLSPEGNEVVDQGPTDEEILLDPVAAGDTTAQQVSQS